MPHLVICYTANLERETDLTVLCRSLADTLLGIQDENSQPVFPVGGTRVLAFAAAHYAVADGGAAGGSAATAALADPGDYAFVYLNLRMGRGRSSALHQRVGNALLLTTQTHFQQLFAQRPIGITLHIDEGQEVFDAKHSNLHPLFAGAVACRGGVSGASHRASGAGDVALVKQYLDIGAQTLLIPMVDAQEQVCWYAPPLNWPTVFSGPQRLRPAHWTV